MHIKKRLFGLFAISLMAWSFSAYAADKPQEPIKTVALIEAVDMPLDFDIHQSGWIPWFVRIGVSSGVNAAARDNAASIAPALKALDYNPSRVLNETVVKALKAAGIKVVTLKDVPRAPKSPNDVKHAAVKHEADAILHLGIAEIMFELPRGQEAYWPRFSTWGYVYDRNGKSSLLGADAAFQRDYKEGKDPGYFRTTEDLSFASEEKIIEDPAKLKAVVHATMQTMADFIANELLKQWPK
jgi:hypothetical protein